MIATAIKKIGGDNENDVCRYLPMIQGGYMHHFTWRKMKNEVPGELGEMIQKFIIGPSNPKRVTPKPRAARGSRKRQDHISLTRGDLEQMLKIMRDAGQEDFVRKLSPKRDLRAIKRELIASVRQGNVDHDLWISYVEVVTAHNNAVNCQPTINGAACVTTPAGTTTITTNTPRFPHSNN